MLLDSLLQGLSSNSKTSSKVKHVALFSIAFFWPPISELPLQTVPQIDRRKTTGHHAISWCLIHLLAKYDNHGLIYYDLIYLVATLNTQIHMSEKKQISLSGLNKGRVYRVSSYSDGWIYIHPHKDKVHANIKIKFNFFSIK